MREGSHSLSRRLVFSLSGLLVLFWVAATAFGIDVMREEFDEVFDSALQETTERMVPLVVDDLFRRESREEPYSVMDARHDVDDAYLTYQVRDNSGRVLLHSSNAPSTAFTAPLVPGFWSGDRQRIFTAVTVSGSLFVQVSDSLDHRAEATEEGAVALVLPVMLLLPLGMLAIWWIVRRAMSPVERLLQAISERDGANLSPISMPDLPSELAPITRSINTLMDRLQGSIEAERQLAANSAHELRTPVAGALAQTELLLEELGDHAASGRAQQVMRGLRRLSVMLEKLLQLSRAEAGIGRAEEAIELGGLFDLVLSDFERSHPDVATVVERSEDGAGIRRRIDPDAFGIVLKNLLENAARYGLPDQPVSVTLTAGGQIRVANATPPLSEPDVNVLRQRFRRGSPAGPGSGLGLAIVDQLMGQMGGALRLSATTGEGGITIFEAVLDFSEE